MKQRNLFAVILIAITVGIGGWIVTKQVIATPANREAQIELVEPYTAEFNEDAIDNLLDPNALDFYRDPNLDAGGSDHTLTPGGN